MKRLFLYVFIMALGGLIPGRGVRLRSDFWAYTDSSHSKMKNASSLDKIITMSKSVQSGHMVIMYAPAPPAPSLLDDIETTSPGPSPKSQFAQSSRHHPDRRQSS